MVLDVTASPTTIIAVYHNTKSNPADTVKTLGARLVLNILALLPSTRMKAGSLQHDKAHMATLVMDGLLSVFTIDFTLHLTVQSSVVYLPARVVKIVGVVKC